ncbi:hypothetical protein P691DRAFT_780114 [Macrolepiota fuliginosa MF-IS2]|uniref:Protein kinase domain-containing protein n=1 Tax=Macrolepiota fuliginosa MF-IS2 TaxID=1400762 RepID=A0A9P5WWL3_9AGAR|nr:hypothetical protein P691DRAFT_780114 [Macrolepiota fuliginosa MF-IS2]
MYKKGVIHRDVSAYNGIITKTGGHIIDFDHSKITTQFMPLPRDGTTLDPGLRTLLSRQYDDESIQLAQDTYGGQAAIYLLGVSYLRSLSVDGHVHTVQDLGWRVRDGPFYDRPLFTGGRAGKGYITGTPPFISPQLTGDVAHDGIHDGDSLWWVFFFILVKYTGPGTPQSREISKSNAPSSDGPRDASLTASGVESAENILRVYFLSEDETTLRKDKLKLFTDKALLDRILEHAVSDYFNDLKPLIKSWYDLLRHAWRYPNGYEYHYPHHSVRELLEKALSDIQATPDDEYAAMIQTEEKRRKEWYEDDRKAVFNQVTIRGLEESGDTLNDPPPAISQEPQNTVARPATPPPIPSTFADPTTPPPQAQNKGIHLLSPSTLSSSSGRPQKKTRKRDS